LDKDSVTDDVLLRRCAQGDEGAFQVLYERHNRMLYNLLFRILGNHADAEEVLPDVFVKAWLKAADFRGHSRVSTWLYRIAANMATDRLRSGRIGKEVFWEELPPHERAMPDVHGHIESPEHAALRREDEALLAQAIGRLAQEDRLLVTLYHLQECTYAEIEEITGISAANIKSKLFRARRRLRTHMTSLQKGDAPDDVQASSSTPTGLRLAAASRR
jgi:RNA polymerase sigma factor (sigma-70 family)